MRFKNLLENSLNKIFPNTADMVVFNIYHLVTCKCWLWILQYMSFWCVFLCMFFLAFIYPSVFQSNLFIIVILCSNGLNLTTQQLISFFQLVKSTCSMDEAIAACLKFNDEGTLLFFFFLREGRRNTLETTAKLVIKLPCKLEGSTRGSI